MPMQSFSMVAEKLRLSEDELREFISEQKLAIGGKVNVLSEDKVKLIEERLSFTKKQEKKKQKDTDVVTDTKNKVVAKGKTAEADEIAPVAVDTTPAAPPKPPAKIVSILAPISPKELALATGVAANEIIKKLFENNIVVNLNQEIDFETAAIVISDFNIELEEEQAAVSEDDKTILELLADASATKFVDRPPVVTIMGHVDHGKTTLLDAIRDTNVVAKEVGGITQRIGAYQVEKKGKKITFIDTPGHEAFTEMRARGAQVTDIAILVVAADDGVQPQTLEALNHARAANVPIIIAINKMDKPEADPDRVKRELADHNLLVEEWGGNTVVVPISAKKKTGLEELLEMILLVADLQELKAPLDIPAFGTIVESHLDKGKGPVATVLVQGGTLHVGDTVVVGGIHGKVRAMTDCRLKKIKTANPSDPAEINGLSEVPHAGDIVRVFLDEKIARALADRRRLRARSAMMSSRNVVSLDTLSERLKEGNLDQLNLILKTDTKGSLEAIKGSLDKIDQSEVRIGIIHEGIGDISNSDVSLASASGAIVIGFSVKIPPLIDKSAKLLGVEVLIYDIIYNLLDHVQQAITGIIKAKPKEVYRGKMKIKARFATFPTSVIVGGEITDGFIKKNFHAKILRGDEQVGTGKVKIVRRVSVEVPQVDKGLECGIQFETTFRKINADDVLELYEWEGTSLSK
ncbi:MAG: translation initiation factor IF-2 [bacterium]